MDHIHGSYESTNRFRINPFSRQIINESEIEIAIAQYDHNSERFIFELPKMVEEHDMSLCNFIRIHYINAGKNETHKDVYNVEDLKTNEDDTDTVTFSWLLSKSATSIAGVLGFAIEFTCITDGVVQYSWRTHPFESIKIPETYDNSDDIVEEDYYDILEAWKEELFASFEDFSMDNYYTKDETLSAIKAAVADLVDSSPETLDTLNELADALGNDPNFAATTLELIGKKADALAGMQKISLVGISTLDRELSDVEFITEDSIQLSIPGTITIDFQGYARFRMVVSDTVNTLLIDGNEVDANPFLSDDFVLEYNGFIDDNIQVICNKGCEHTVEFYGIPDAVSKIDLAEIDDKINSKANALAGMNRKRLRLNYRNGSIDRDLVSGEKSVDNALTLLSPATITINSRGYVRICVTCDDHATDKYTHRLYVDGVEKSSIAGSSSGNTLSYTGYVLESIVIKNFNPYNTTGAYTLTFEIYELPNAIPESEIDDKINANALTASASGEAIRVDDVSPFKHKAVAKVGRKRNILPMPYYEKSKTVNGVTITINDDGSITINGTCTGALGFTIFKGSIPLNGKYTLSGVTNDGESTHYLQPYIDEVFQTTVINGSRTYEIKGNLTQLALYVKTGFTFENVVVYPQLEEGTTATEYEPYVDPTTVTVKSFGKNIFPTLPEVTKDGITLSKVDDYYVLNGTATSSGLITVTKSLSTGTYILSANNPTHNGLDLAIVQIYSDTTKQSMVAKDNAVNSTHTMELLASSDYQFRIRYENGVTYSNYIVKPQLELGSNATDYEPHKGRFLYTPSEDGTVEIDAIAPTMTVLTDASGVNIDLEYQQDHNKAMNDVRADITTLDNDLADIKTTLGDLETLLGGI